MKLAHIALLVSLLAAALLLIGGPGARFELWDFRFGFQLMRYALYAGGAGAVLAILFLLIPTTRRGHVLSLVVALVIGAAVALVPIQIRQTAQSVPFIHDVTTDTTNPPPFVDIAELRRDAPNPVEYPGTEVAEQQREAYPEIETLESGLARDALFEAALATARDQGWEIVSSVPEDGRIEATDTTFWYGFKDDVVIRIQSAPNGSRLDLRSKSRVGGSDLGANAERINAYLDDLRARIDE